MRAVLAVVVLAAALSGCAVVSAGVTVVSVGADVVGTAASVAGDVITAPFPSSSDDKNK